MFLNTDILVASRVETLGYLLTSCENRPSDDLVLLETTLRCFCQTQPILELISIHKNV